MKYRVIFLLNLACLALLAVLLAMPLAQTFAQRRGGGHALDSSLQLGSGGYNRRGGSRTGMQRSRYSTGGSRSLYVVGRSGNLRYSRNNAFAPRSRYRSTGYAGDRSSNSYQRRFRYQGSGTSFR